MTVTSSCDVTVSLTSRCDCNTKSFKEISTLQPRTEWSRVKYNRKRSIVLIKRRGSLKYAKGKLAENKIKNLIIDNLKANYIFFPVLWW